MFATERNKFATDSTFDRRLIMSPLPKGTG